MGRVTLAPVDPNLFSDTALEAARACTSLKENKPAQLRKFYDELVMWHDKVHFAQSTEAKEAKFKVHLGSPWNAALTFKKKY